MKGHGPKNPPTGCNLGGLPQLKLKRINQLSVRSIYIVVLDLFYNDLELLRLDPHIGTEAGPQQQQYQMLLDRQWKRQPSISHLLEV